MRLMRPCTCSNAREVRFTLQPAGELRLAKSNAVSAASAAALGGRPKTHENELCASLVRLCLHFTASK